MLCLCVCARLDATPLGRNYLMINAPQIGGGGGSSSLAVGRSLMSHPAENRTLSLAELVRVVFSLVSLLAAAESIKVCAKILLSGAEAANNYMREAKPICELSSTIFPHTQPASKLVDKFAHLLCARQHVS